MSINGSIVRDKLIWDGATHGCYTVQTRYKLAIKILQVDGMGNALVGESSHA